MNEVNKNDRACKGAAGTDTPAAGNLSAADAEGRRGGGLSPESILVHGATPFDPVTGAISVPIYQSATFRHPGLGESTGFDYSRGVNPTRSELEKTLALAEHGKYGLAFATGMGAISALIKLFRPGDHIIVSEDLYGGTYRLFSEFYSRYGYSFSWIDTSDFSLIER
ncbi:MAG: PLP-dependent transferase, partial [Treponema sp.]|nr:PLP-dependent transferase [Treponema sp.]